MIRAAMASVSDTSVIPLADWLHLGAGARINTPSTTMGNWQWRADASCLTDELAQHIARQTQIYGRIPHPAPAKGAGKH